MNDHLRPGNKAPHSGQYAVYDEKHRRVPGRQVTAVKGRSLPPLRSGWYYKLSDETKHIS